MEMEGLGLKCLVFAQHPQVMCKLFITHPLNSSVGDNHSDDSQGVDSCNKDTSADTPYNRCVTCNTAENFS